MFFEILNSNHKHLDNQMGHRLVNVIGFLTDLRFINMIAA